MNRREVKSAPVLRFKGFTNDWEQRKFENLVSRLSKTSNNESLPNVTYDDIKSKENSLNKDITELTHGKKGIHFNKDDILFGKLRPYLGNILLARFNGIAVGDFWVLSPKDNNISSFLFDLIHTSKYKYISNLSSGSKMPRSDWNLVSKASFWVPIQQEQNKIGKIFQLIDNLVSLQQRKLESFQFTYHEIIRRLFLKKAKWQQTKLSDLVTILDKNRKPVKKEDRLFGDTPYYGANGIQDYISGFTHKGEFILIAEDGANSLTEYPIYFVKGQIWVNNHAHVLKVNKDVSPLFLALALKQINYSKYTVGSSRNKLNLKDLENIAIFIPDNNEQQKIGQFYSNYLNYLRINKKRIQYMKQFKQFLLQNMFI